MLELQSSSEGIIQVGAEMSGEPRLLLRENCGACLDRRGHDRPSWRQYRDNISQPSLTRLTPITVADTHPGKLEDQSLPLINRHPWKALTSKQTSARHLFHVYLPQPLHHYYHHETMAGRPLRGLGSSASIFLSCFRIRRGVVSNSQLRRPHNPISQSASAIPKYLWLICFNQNQAYSE